MKTRTKKTGRPSGGRPRGAASREALDEVDSERALIAYRFWYPTVSCEGIFNGNRELGAKDNESAVILAAGPRHVGFTLNSDTPYGNAVVDLRSGPFVVELPPGPYMALALSHDQAWIMDMGLSGPDAGKGGKHLLLPPDFRGDVPAGYHVGRSPTWKAGVAIRFIPRDGDMKAGLDALRSIKIQPLAGGAPLRYMDVSEKKMDGTCLRWEAGLEYWKALWRVIGEEPGLDEQKPMLGLLAALGIEKGRPFPSDGRLLDILERAARDGRDRLLASAFAGSREDRVVWRDRQWEWAALRQSGDFVDPAGVIDLEARERWFAQAIGASPAMFRRSPGAGSLYWLGARDKSGAPLDGGKSYTLSVPRPVPAGLFWSVTVYDAETRSQVQTSQDRAALRSLFELKGDSGADLCFGPKAPRGAEERWIKTAPGRGWFAYFRIYGPESTAFDGGWKPGDFIED